MEIPDSMDKCVYFTRRNSEAEGKLIAWAEKKECPECHKGLMGKPIEKGKKKIRATEYVCPECGYSEGKPEHEDTLTVNVQYTCPHCQHSGEATTPYKRKSFLGVKAYVFVCDGCGAKIGIAQKMKKPKK